MLSLILWALIIVVTLKYVVILLRADNNGEGGTLALMALAQRAVGVRRRGHRAARHHQRRAVLRRRGDHAGAVGAVRRSKASSSSPPAFDPYVVPLTIVILLVLFAVQSRGTARVAAFFGPIMCVWFAVHRGRGAAADRRASRACCRRSIRSTRVVFLLHHGVIGFVDARRGLSRGHRRRGALRRSRPFRQAADPDRLARRSCCRRWR